MFPNKMLCVFNHLIIISMKKLKPVFGYFLVLVLFIGAFSSCADNKDFIIDGEEITVEPYAWFDLQAKNDSIEYKINPGNIVLDIIFSETIIVPILLTGNQLYEPARKK